MKYSFNTEGVVKIMNDEDVVDSTIGTNNVEVAAQVVQMLKDAEERIPDYVLCMSGTSKYVVLNKVNHRLNKTYTVISKNLDYGDAKRLLNNLYSPGGFVDAEYKEMLLRPADWMFASG